MVVSLFVLFLALLVLGVPVAFVLGLTGLTGVLIFQSHVPLTVITSRMFGSIDSFTLLAIPFFILAGELMETGGLTVRIVSLARALVGHIRGGLAHVVVVGQMLFSGISGSTTADAAAMGSVMVPTMVKSGYSPERASAIISAASGAGILVPPSLGMVIYGSMTGTSIAALFAAGFVPAFLTAGMLMLHIYFEARNDRRIQVSQRATLSTLFRAFRQSWLALLLPVIIFGGILGGVFTPTEAAVVAAVYALCIGVFVYKEVKPADLPHIFARTGMLTGVVMLLIATASIFSWVLTIQQVPQTIADLIQGLGGGQSLFLLLSLVIFLILFAALDGTPGLLMVIPIFVPIAEELGIDPLHYGIVITAVTGIALFLPPVGVGLFIVVNIAGTTVGRVAPALLPYQATMFLACLAIAYVPWITFVVPRLLGL